MLRDTRELWGMDEWTVGMVNNHHVSTTLTPLTLSRRSIYLRSTFETEAFLHLKTELRPSPAVLNNNPPSHLPLAAPLYLRPSPPPFQVVIAGWQKKKKKRELKALPSE